MLYGSYLNNSSFDRHPNFKKVPLSFSGTGFVCTGRGYQIWRAWVSICPGASTAAVGKTFVFVVKTTVFGFLMIGSNSGLLSNLDNLNCHKGYTAFDGSPTAQFIRSLSSQFCMHIHSLCKFIFTLRLFV